MQIKELSLDHINNINSIPRSEDLEDLVISENTSIESIEDGPAIVTRCKNLTVNAGVTWSLTNRCEGWDIVVNGNLTVDGTVSMNSLGILRAADIINKIFGFYQGENLVEPGQKADVKTAFNWKHKEFTIASGGTATDGGTLNIYVNGNVTIGAAGVISANGATGKNGGTVHIYYTGTFANAGSVTANGGTGGTAGTITIEDFTYLLTERTKSPGTGVYIYSMIDLQGVGGVDAGKAMFGTRDTGHVWYSEDWGLNWTDQGEIIANVTIRCFLNFGNGKIWIGTGENTVGGAKIYETLNYGVTWSLKATLGAASEQRVCCICMIDSNTILAGTRNNGNLYKTIDGGLNWTNIGQVGSATNIRSLCYLGNGIVLIGTKEGKIYQSADSGATNTLKATLTGTPGKVREFCNFGNGVVLAGCGNGSIWKSSNALTDCTWTPITTFITYQEIAFFLSVKDGSGKVLVSTSPQKIAGTDTQRHLAISEDSGETWRRITRFTSTVTNAFAIKEQEVFFGHIPKGLINIPINHFGAT